VSRSVRMLFGPLTVLLAALGILASVPVATAQTWALTWSDEFIGTGALSSSNWTYDLGNGYTGWGNNELEYYQYGTANANQAGGILTIQARQQSVGGMSYTSARIKTQGIRSFGPGDSAAVKLEALIAGPSGQGLWPAFWMLGTNITSVPWPACGEIDIMEHINSATTAPMTLHWASATGVHVSGALGTANVGATFGNFHTYAITWDANAITGFFDGTNLGNVNIAASINSTEEFHKPFFMLMNLAVGGGWPAARTAPRSFRRT